MAHSRLERNTEVDRNVPHLPGQHEVLAATPTQRQPEEAQAGAGHPRLSCSQGTPLLRLQNLKLVSARVLLFANPSGPSRLRFAYNLLQSCQRLLASRSIHIAMRHKP